jgi:hypothetical protein
MLQSSTPLTYTRGTVHSRKVTGGRVSIIDNLDVILLHNLFYNHVYVGYDYLANAISSVKS